MREVSDRMKKINVEDVSRYLTLVLIAILIVALVIIVILPNTETKSICTGFQYFLFLDQKMTESSYTVELLNGVRDIEVKGILLDGLDLGINSQQVASGEKFTLQSSKDPTTRNVNDTFVNKLLITYDIIDGIKDNKDVATCTGRVQ